jgi:hypothetical protein
MVIGIRNVRWFDNAENYLKKMRVRGWTKISMGRNAWKLILKEAKDLHGVYSQC